MIDPVSAFYGLKYGYKGTRAALDWLDSLKGGKADMEQLREALNALAEDNERLIELTQEHHRKIGLLQKWLVAACLVLVAQAGVVTWLILKH